jgi:hypothetical protein
MEMERIALNQRERHRLRLLHEVRQTQIAQREAARRLKISDRHIYRLVVSLAKRGDCGGSAASFGELAMQDSSPVCFAGWRSVARLFRGLATRAMRIHAWIQDSGWKSAPSDRRSPLSAGMEPGVATPKKSAWVFAVRRWKTATGWLALATLLRPLSAPTPWPAPAAR